MLFLTTPRQVNWGYTLQKGLQWRASNVRERLALSAPFERVGWGGRAEGAGGHYRKLLNGVSDATIRCADHCSLSSQLELLRIGFRLVGAVVRVLLPVPKPMYPAADHATRGPPSCTPLLD